MTKDAVEAPGGAVVIYQPKAEALTQISTLDAGRAALIEKYKGKTYDCMKPAEMEEAKKARMEIREARYKVPHIIKAFKTSQKEDLAVVEGGGDTLTAEFFELENPIHAQIEAAEKLKAEEKVERERLKAVRLTDIRAKILGLNQFLTMAAGYASEELTLHIERVELGILSAEIFAELLPEANQVRTDVLVTLKAQLAALVEKEANDKRLADEAAETARKAGLQLRLDTIRRVPIDCASVQCWDELEAQIKHLGATDLSDMQEYEEAAVEAITKGVADITAMILQKKAAKKLADDQAAFDKQQADAAEKLAADAARTAKLTEIAGIPLLAFQRGFTADQIQLEINDTDAIECAGDAALIIAVENALNGLRTLHAAKVTEEESAARIAAKQEMLDAAQKEKDDAEAAEVKRKDDLAAAEQAEREAALIVDVPDVKVNECCAEGIMAKIEAQGFNCKKGSLATCDEWQELKTIVAELRADSNLMNACRAHGVDNWGGWDDAIESLEVAA